MAGFQSLIEVIIANAA
jgi:hypothetical protein